MKCSFENCAGQYETQNVTHTVRRDGQIVVIDHVPAEVCAICGDVLLLPETVRAIERLLADMGQPHSSVPLYEFA
jgi:YgiT-type zinc finger domain-containing protein